MLAQSMTMRNVRARKAHLVGLWRTWEALAGMDVLPGTVVGISLATLYANTDPTNAGSAQMASSHTTYILTTDQAHGSARDAHIRISMSWIVFACRLGVD